MGGYQSGGQTESERERLILEHLGQVHLIAGRIHDRLPDHIPIDDLISTGVIGLISAIDNFDPSRNVQLKTYAEHKIRGAIFDSLRGLDWAPRMLRKRAKEIEAAIDACKQMLRREPTEDEIAAQLKISLEEYRNRLLEIQGIDLETVEYASSGGEGLDLFKFISDDEENLPSRIVERSELERLVADAIERMPKTERTVLSLYYQEELSLREIAQVLNCHLSRASQLKAQAVLRVRAYLEKRLAYPVRPDVASAVRERVAAR